MYLKEAFRYQNYLRDMITRATACLRDPDYTMRTTELHMRSKAAPEAEDEEIDRPAETATLCAADEMVDLTLDLLTERERVTHAISEAKACCEINIDDELAGNAFRRSIGESFATLGRMKPSERTKSGTDFRFNAEGNQVPYVYKVKETTTTAFDQPRVKQLSGELLRHAEQVSAEVDRVMVMTEVKYTPKYCPTDSFEETVERFLANREALQN